MYNVSCERRSKMFLKRLEIQGFKSFPDHIVIEFNNAITGIVGPNGCGKSNITDAIKWVLGEQSVKNMRGSSMSDVIFSGSSARKKVNVAMVTMVIDNSDKRIDSPLDEIEITRKIHRDSGEGEYYINKKPCRLKDIIDLTLEVGLGRDSLAIISQGTVSQFADQKPQERRGIFEDAAGVAKYKKRKIEALNKLNRTQDNVDRLLDIVAELEKQVVPLKRASKKALIYREKQHKLQEIEVAVLVHEIEKYASEIETIKETLDKQEQDFLTMESAYNINEHKMSALKEELEVLDSTIHKDQETLMVLMRDISRLEGRKTELDEKSKYVLEVGNLEDKIKELSNLVAIAHNEYQDRVNRLSDLNTNLELYTQQNHKVATELVELNSQFEALNSRKYQLTNRRNNQQQLLDRPFIAQAGIQAILQHKQSLQGVYDVVAKLLQAKDGYELAISTALSGASNNIVTRHEEDAKAAIRFLKANRSGRATFTPLSVIKERYVKSDDMVIANNVQGFKGIASELVDCEERFRVLAKNLLGNVLVCEDLDSANTLSRYLNYRYKVVSIEGDIFHIGGNITGGQQKENTSLLLAKKEIENIDKQLSEVNLELEMIDKKRVILEKQGQEVSSSMLETRLQIANIEPFVDVKQAKYEKLKQELALLEPEKQAPQDVKDELIVELNKTYLERDSLVTHISTSREKRVNTNTRLQSLSSDNSGLRKAMNQLTSDINQAKITITKAETNIENAMTRLADEYQMTYEFASSQESDVDLSTARDLVSELRYDIAKLGSINMSAPEEYEEVNERYEFLSRQLKELQQAKQELLDFISEMDEVMTTQFKEMFTKINQEFNTVFTTLFGGGKAKLVLEDPEDLLNSGIDIDVQPPGKTIQNIRLFSGGEKSLIAISVLFAIMKTKNLPLIIFDEVEAALDQANVNRFATYIREFSDNSQFIVVTHRPGTMSECDILYGVTMQQQGVSNVLKVQLKDATKMAEGDN